MREKLIELLKLSPSCICDLCGEKGRFDEVAEIIADNLIANGVTIPVRCKDCKHFWSSFSGTHSCKLHKGLVGTKYDSFCSYGERRTDDERTG